MASCKGEKSSASTHPETALDFWDVQLGSEGSPAPQVLHQLLGLNRWQAEVGLVGLKVNLRLAIPAPSG